MILIFLQAVTYMPHVFANFLFTNKKTKQKSKLFCVIVGSHIILEYVGPIFSRMYREVRYSMDSMRPSVTCSTIARVCDKE